MIKLLQISTHETAGALAEKINKNLQALFSAIQEVEGKLAKKNGHTTSMPDIYNKNSDHDKRYLRQEDAPALVGNINPLYLGDPGDLDTVRLYQVSGVLYIQKQSILGVWDNELYSFS